MYAHLMERSPNGNLNFRFSTNIRGAATFTKEGASVVIANIKIVGVENKNLETVSMIKAVDEYNKVIKQSIQN